MIFPFPVKHNGVNYEPGQEVPIGKEPVKENAYNDKSANEIRKELREVYGVTKFPSNKKEDLIAMLKEKEEEAKNKARNDKKEEDESDEDVDNTDDSDEDENDGEDTEDSDSEDEGEEVETPEGKSSFLNKIMGK